MSSDDDNNSVIFQYIWLSYKKGFVGSNIERSCTQIFDNQHHCNMLKDDPSPKIILTSMYISLLHILYKRYQNVFTRADLFWVPPPKCLATKTSFHTGANLSGWRNVKFLNIPFRIWCRRELFVLFNQQHCWLILNDSVFFTKLN